MPLHDDPERPAGPAPGHGGRSPATTAAWDGTAYAANTAHHRAFDDHVLEPLDIRPDWRVLDVGCGTGDFTARLAALVPEGSVLGVDASASQVEVARLHQAGRRNLSFMTWDARRLAELAGSPRAPAAGFDLAVSVATLHWIAAADHPAVFAGLRAVLRTGGTLRAEFGGTGQIAQTQGILDDVSASLGGPQSPWTFPAPDEVAAQLRSSGFDLSDGWTRLVEQRRSLPTEAAFAGWLTSQVLIAYEAAMDPAIAASFRTRALERCLDECRLPDGTYDQRYVRIDLLATAA